MLFVSGFIGINGGDLATAGGVPGDCRLGADEFCAAAAIIFGPTIREAAPTLTNWVLESDTSYVNVSNEVVATTSESSIFSFPLTYKIQNAFNYVWTGMNNDWSTSGNTCMPGGTSWVGPFISDTKENLDSLLLR